MRQRHQPIDDRASLAGREQGVDFAFVLHTFRLLLSFPPQEPRLYEFRDGCLKARTRSLRGSAGQNLVVGFSPAKSHFRPSHFRIDSIGGGFAARQT
jgi:hypothetical protein